MIAESKGGISMIYNGEAIDLLECIETPVSLIMADPPDNLGLDYGPCYKDKRYDYYQWLELVVRRALPKCKTLWLSYYHAHDFEITHFVREIIKDVHRSFEPKKFIWRFTFGQYQDTDCGSGFRFLLRLRRPDAVHNVDAIRVPSARMESGDSRAAGPRVPDDVWDFPRVVGNAKERRPWHPTQHPNVLYERIIKLSSNPNDVCVDLFGGTGTMIRTCRALVRRPLISEINPDYCNHIWTEAGDQQLVAGQAMVREWLRSGGVEQL